MVWTKPTMFDIVKHVAKFNCAQCKHLRCGNHSVRQGLAQDEAAQQVQICSASPNLFCKVTCFLFCQFHLWPTPAFNIAVWLIRFMLRLSGVTWDFCTQFSICFDSHRMFAEFSLYAYLLCGATCYCSWHHQGRSARFSAACSSMKGFLSAWIRYLGDWFIVFVSAACCTNLVGAPFCKELFSFWMECHLIVTKDLSAGQMVVPQIRFWIGMSSRIERSNDVSAQQNGSLRYQWHSCRL